MNKKQILMIGGGTVFGAIAAAGMLTAIQSYDRKGAGSTSGETSDSRTTPHVKFREPGSAEEVDGKLRLRGMADEMATKVTGIDTEELKGRAGEIRESMRERQMDNLNSKIAKWSAVLGLDDQQKEKLLDAASSQMAELETLAEAAKSGDPAAIAESAKRAMSILSGRALEESMGGVLTESQKTQYASLGAGRTTASAESRTLRQLASLQDDLMLTPDQRTSAYGIMYESNLKQVEGNSDVSAMIDQFTSQSGITLDPSMEGAISAMATRGLTEAANGGTFSQETIQNMAVEAANDSINQQIDQLRPVLTEPQIELYRTQLEARYKNLGSLIPGAAGIK